MKDFSEKISNIKKDTGFLDQTLRPLHFEEYVGQTVIKQNLHILFNPDTFYL